MIFRDTFNQTAAGADFHRVDGRHDPFVLADEQFIPGKILYQEQDRGYL